MENDGNVRCGDYAASFGGGVLRLNFAEGEIAISDCAPGFPAVLDALLSGGRTEFPRRILEAFGFRTEDLRDKSKHGSAAADAPANSAAVPGESFSKPCGVESSSVVPAGIVPVDDVRTRRIYGSPWTKEEDSLLFSELRAKGLGADWRRLSEETGRTISAMKQRRGYFLSLKRRTGSPLPWEALPGETLPDETLPANASLPCSACVPSGLVPSLSEERAPGAVLPAKPSKPAGNIPRELSTIPQLPIPEMSRNLMPWTQEEEFLVLAMHRSGLGNWSAGRRIGRSATAIAMRLDKILRERLGERPWTFSENFELRRCSPDDGERIATFAEKSGRGTAEVRRRILELRWSDSHPEVAVVLRKNEVKKA